ncbi:hypothetical protein AX16_007823 [Volvariella volvacea WC 439]|nr:hypothetical protein AX16_007823 [Volvariella volvacea WC 439]
MKVRPFGCAFCDYTATDASSIFKHHAGKHKCPSKSVGPNGEEVKVRKLHKPTYPLLAVYFAAVDNAYEVRRPLSPSLLHAFWTTFVSDPSAEDLDTTIDPYPEESTSQSHISESSDTDTSEHASDLDTFDHTEQQNPLDFDEDEDEDEDATDSPALTPILEAEDATRSASATPTMTARTTVSPSPLPDVYCNLPDTTASPETVYNDLDGADELPPSPSYTHISSIAESYVSDTPYAEPLDDGVAPMPQNGQLIQHTVASSATPTLDTYNKQYADNQNNVNIQANDDAYTPPYGVDAYNATNYNASQFYNVSNTTTQLNTSFLNPFNLDPRLVHPNLSTAQEFYTDRSIHSATAANSPDCGRPGYIIYKGFDYPYYDDEVTDYYDPIDDGQTQYAVYPEYFR